MCTVVSVSVVFVLIVLISFLLMVVYCSVYCKSFCKTSLFHILTCVFADNVICWLKSIFSDGNKASLFLMVHIIVNRQVLFLSD